MATKKIQAAVMESIKKWQKLMFLDHWVLTVTFVDDSDLDVYGTCTPEYFALRAEIEINLNQLEENDIDELVIHELLHVLLAPVENIIEEAVENTDFAHSISTRDVEACIAQLTRIISNGYV